MREFVYGTDERYLILKTTLDTNKQWKNHDC